MDIQQVADQLMADFHQERQLVDLMIQGCIEYRWAVGNEERQIAEAMIYNAFETYAIERGFPLPQAEEFCEDYLDDLVRAIDEIL
ncbi:MAG: hypothetical protein KME07_13185 [Pegethrix bostrychoides GSE-TBD4-15B]|jgi:hypothetical protein|uniref:Uncharacterized protein n=1 Tax=Pegethrix bostrychoides GSE-TBD4-15B TaxID=2839662 RepID=A0A951PB08_9CYAN|nr:hypothetical protein [Pegethrix bostrychoides GSE-TBD4-15B]